VAGAAIDTVSGVASACLLAGLVTLSLCIGVAVLRYRLFDIDRVISRTLGYAIVTGLLVGVYAGIMLLATEALRFHHINGGGSGGDPGRGRAVQPAAPPGAEDRGPAVQPGRYDADRIIAAFAARLQDAVDLDAVRADLASPVQRALEPAHVSVWIQAAERQ
jgi:hypothetical protein